MVNKSILILFDGEHRIISANDTFFHVSGYSYESLLHKPIAALFQNFRSPLPFDFAHEPLILIMANEEKHPVYGEICRLPHYPFSPDQWVLIGSENETHMANRCCACHNIIHDINNVLAAAYANLSMMDMEADTAATVSNRKTELWTALRRLNDFLVELRHAGNGAAIMKAPCSISDIVKKSLNLAVSGHDTVAVSFSCAENIPAVTANEHALFRVFYNVFVNACEAIKNNGLITVKITFEEKGSAGSTAQSMVQVTIGDSGPGIHPEILPSIFLPSVSTKGGTRGMGLYIAKNIIEKHGGTITATADSLFVIRLPAG